MTMKALYPAGLFLISPVLGFLPPVSTRSASTTEVVSPKFFLSSVSSDTSTATANPFASYELGQSTLAYKDETVGQGESAKDGDVLKVSFVGRLYPSGQQIAKNDDFVFELGEGKTLPGFDKALGGTQVGTRRIIRVPPSLAYGTRGNAPRIPPNADLEFDVEVKEITRDKLQGQIAKFGTGRLLGFIACFAVFALSPFLS